MKMKFSRDITIECRGMEEADLDLAQQEVFRLICEGFTAGTNRNETGSFSFSVHEDEEA
jgi:hypothetical protein